MSGLIIILLLPCFLNAQDTCNNIIFHPIDAIVNPSFESTSDTCISGLDISTVTGWYRATSGVVGYVDSCSGFKFTPDYIQAKQFVPPTVPTSPNGKGALFFVDNAPRPNKDILPPPVNKSYVATVLKRPLKKDSLYKLSFYVGFGIKGRDITSGSSPHVKIEARGYSSARQEKIVVWGSSAHHQIIYNTFGCLSVPGSEWFPIATLTITKPDFTAEWFPVNMQFTPTQDINSIAIGSSCDAVPFPSPYGVTLAAEYAYFLNDVQFYEATIPGAAISVASGSLCDDPSKLVTLKVTTSNYYSQSSFQWFKDHQTIPNANTSSLTLSQNLYGEGEYRCRIQNDSVCFLSDSFFVHWTPTPAPNLLGSPDTTVCGRDTAFLNAYIDPTATYRWQDNSTNAVFPAHGNGTYTVAVKNVCGAAIASKTVHYTDCNYNLYAPTAFTPNADGVNDVFRIKFFYEPSSFRLIIFNRFGQTVFSTTDEHKGWDGTIKGIQQPTGAYTWLLEYNEHHGPYKVQKGTVVLLR